MTDTLPTTRTTLRTGWLCVLVWCRACRHQTPADLQAIIDAGRGDVPLNAVSERLATAPEHYAPVFERIDDGTVLAHPWSMGFLAAMKLRHNGWQPLLTLSRIEQGLLLPILLHCTDDAGRPMLGPTRPGPEAKEFLRTAYHVT